MTNDSGLAGQKATVVGLGMEGTDLVRYLAARGADVTVSDTRQAELLSVALNELAGVRMRLSLGAHDEEILTESDCLYISQGVPLDLPPLAAARKRGVPLRSMMQIFLQECPATVVGVTGSSGKSTVTALLGEMFKAGGRDTFVGGNIGVPLLSHLPELTPESWVVLEMSHTQLQLSDRSPAIATVINVTPNHLDRFSWEQYVQLKRNILRFQTTTDLAVLNADNEVSHGFTADTLARVVLTSLQRRPAEDGVYLRGETVVASAAGSESELLDVADVHLPGRHNLEDVVVAAAVAFSSGLDPSAIRSAVRSFHGIPHRLELVRRVNSVGYYNDSIATTPERAVAALRAFDRPSILLAGGHHKNLPWNPLVQEATSRCRAVVCFGEAGPEIAEELRGAGFSAIESHEELHDAVEAASRLSRPGDVVLFSPACTSFDAYDNFEQRGDHFRRLVVALRENA